MKFWKNNRQNRVRSKDSLSAAICSSKQGSQKPRATPVILSSIIVDGMRVEPGVKPLADPPRATADWDVPIIFTFFLISYNGKIICQMLPN